MRKTVTRTERTAIHIVLCIFFTFSYSYMVEKVLKETNVGQMFGDKFMEMFALIFLLTHKISRIQMPDDVRFYVLGSRTTEFSLFDST